MKLHPIKIGNQTIAVVTAKQFTDLHDKMTEYYNAHYQELTETE